MKLGDVTMVCCGVLNDGTGEYLSLEDCENDCQVIF